VRLDSRALVVVAIVVVALGAFAVGGDNGLDLARVAVLAVVCIVSIGMWLRERALSGPLRRISAANGWTFTRSAPGLANRWTGSPFGVGNDRKATSVVRGRVDQRPFTAFNYTVTVSTGRDRVTSYYSVVALDLPVPLPVVEVHHTLGGVEQAIGLTRIEFENEAFNRHYRVTCADARYASDVLNPRTIEALVAGRVVNVRIGGGRAVAWAVGRLEVTEVLGWSRALVTAVDRIPDFVWKDHASGVPAVPDGAAPGLTWTPTSTSLGSMPSTPQEHP
jgi:hypothetical protein